jgi:hypothetical protein
MKSSRRPTDRVPGFCLRSWSGVLLLLPLLLAGCTAHRRPAIARAAAAVDFTYGVLAVDEGDDGEAARLFEAAARENPGDGTTLHWLGLTYLRLGRPAEALAPLQASLRAPQPPAAGRQRVRADLEYARAAVRGGAVAGRPIPSIPAYTPEIQLPGEAPRWEARLSAGVGHDSNPALLTEDLSFTTASGRRIEGGTAAGVADLGLRAEVHPFYDLRGFSLGLAASADRSLHRDLGAVDLTAGTGLVQLAWGSDPQGFLTGPLGYTRVPAGSGRFALLLEGSGTAARLGGDPFLRSTAAALALHLREAPTTVTRIDLATVDRTFSQDVSGPLRASGAERSLAVSQLLFFGRRDRSLRLGVATGDRDAGRAYASRFTTEVAELALPVADRLLFSVAGERREDRFSHPESNLFLPQGPKRDDTTWRITAAALLRLDPGLYWNLRASHARRDSNVSQPLGAPFFDYGRTVVSTGFEWSF